MEFPNNNDDNYRNDEDNEELDEEENEHNTKNPEESSTERIHLSFEQEKRIKKLPTFTVSGIQAPNDKLKQFSDYKPLKIYNIPYFFWSVGLIIIAFAVFLSVNMGIGDDPEKRILDGFHGKHFWEYIILILIYLLGATFFVTAKYETIVIDKQKGEMNLSKFFLLRCRKEFLNIPIDNINSVFPTQVITENSYSNRTCLNKIGIRFNNNNVVYVFKSIFKHFIIRTVMKMRLYLFKTQSTYDAVEFELKGNETHMDVIGQKM